VVGFSGNGSNGGHAFLWTPGGTAGPLSNPQMKDLGTLGGNVTSGPLPSSEGLGINDFGQVVGEAYTTASGPYHAFLWTPTTANGTTGSIQDLGTLAGSGSNSIAYGINPTSKDRVQVVGESDTVDGQHHAFLWTEGGTDGVVGNAQMKDLGVLVGSSGSIAFAINDASQVVGGSYSGGDAFLWQSSTGMTDLGTLGGGSSTARAINAGGQVAGQSYLKSGGEYDAFVWTPTTSNGTQGKMKDLGVLGSKNKVSAAYGINDSGAVVGDSGDGLPGPPTAPFYWPGSGSLRNLTGLVPAGSMTLETAAGINDAGQIAGYTIGGYGHAWLLTPISGSVQIGSFAASPDPATAGSIVTLTAANITDTNPGATITHVAFYVQINGNNTLLGEGTQTSPGVWKFNYTVTLPPGSYTLFAQAEDSYGYGVFGDPLALTLTVL
jgi:probable HAF family extracellular repeat protein